MNKTVKLDIPETAAERVDAQWECAGCGATSTDRIRSCGCATNVVTSGGASAWKLDAASPDQAFLRRIVDLTWNYATESTEVPSTKKADEIISLARAEAR